MDLAASLLLVRSNCAGPDSRTTTNTITFALTITIAFAITATDHGTAPVGRCDVVSRTAFGSRSRYRADNRRCDVVWHRIGPRKVRRSPHANDQRSCVAWRTSVGIAN